LHSTFRVAPEPNVHHCTEQYMSGFDVEAVPV
jgi:hypothetical protein